VEFSKDTEIMSKLEACKTQVVDSYLTFHSISNGNDVNLKEICSDNQISCNVERTKEFDEVSSGHMKAFTSFVNVLKLSSSKALL